TRKLIGIAEREREQSKIYQERKQSEKQTNCIDQNQQSGQQCRPGNERHPERDNTKFIAASAIVRAKTEQFPPGQAEQDQSTGDLKVRHGNSERGENNFPEKNKSDGNAESSEDSQKRLSFSLLARRARAETHEDRDQPDWIDGNKDRNEGYKKLLNKRGAVGRNRAR